jgi:hypothetical protein
VLPPARLRALAADARVKGAQAIARMTPDRRAATLVAFAAAAVAAAGDDAVEHLDRVLGEMGLRVEAQDLRERVRTLSQLDAAGHQLATACALLLDERLDDAGVRAAVFGQVGRERLGRALERFRALARPAHERHHDLMSARYPQVRRFLPALLAALELEATEAGQEVIEAIQALRAIERRRSVRAEEVPLALARRGWRALVEPEPGRLDRRAYTFCVLDALRDGLRRRDVYLPTSERFGDPRATLLADDAWEASREATCRALGLPRQPEPFLEALAAELDVAWHRAGEDLAAGRSARALARGELGSGEDPYRNPV